jgi:CHASE3 domain sensor protein
VSPANAKTLSLLAWSIGLTALLAAILSAAIVWLVEREHTETDLVRHSRAVNTQISEVSLFVQRMETNQRGYLLTARDLYLSNFSDLEKELPALIDETVRLLDGDQRHEERLADLRQVVMEKARELRSTIDEQQAGRYDAARAIVNSDRGFQMMNQIRQLLSEIKNEEDQILFSRLSALQRVSTLLQTGAPIPLLLIGAIGVLTRQYIRRSLSALTVALRQREESQFRLQLAMDAAISGRGGTIRFTAWSPGMRASRKLLMLPRMRPQSKRSWSGRTQTIWERSGRPLMPSPGPRAPRRSSGSRETERSVGWRLWGFLISRTLGVSERLRA